MKRGPGLAGDLQRRLFEWRRDERARQTRADNAFAFPSKKKFSQDKRPEKVDEKRAHSSSVIAQN